MSPIRASRTTTRLGGKGRRLAIATAIAIAAGAGMAAASPGESGGTTTAIVARDYDLGIRLFRQPGMTGKFSRMPIRLWGAIAAPAAPGSHPVVLVAHGAHGDNCPGEFGTWPCFGREQRNDLGLRYLVNALARVGFVAVAPDLNAAHTGGWGEVPKAEELRFGQVVDATLAELARAGRGTPTRFGIALEGKPDLMRLGLLGHSRGGMNVLAWGRGKRAVRSVFLLAPFHDPNERIGDIPATVLLGICDGDTRLEGAKYVTAARRTARTAPIFQLTLAGANHNYYNQTLARMRADDALTGRPSCKPGVRLSASAQQAFLTRVAIDHFTVRMLGAPAAGWMTAPVGGQLYGQKVAVKRVQG